MNTGSLSRKKNMFKIKPEWIKLTPSDRLYQTSLPIIGLSGGIATGKSTVAKLFKDKGIQCVDADAVVKQIYALEETISLVKHLAPDVVIKKTIEFPLLRKQFFTNPFLKDQLEDHIFSLFPKFFKLRIKDFHQQNFILYDVPLLFEKKLHKMIDVSICVFAPRKQQIERILQRDSGSDPSTIESILENQLDIEQKPSLADMTIMNISGIKELEVQFQLVFEKLIEISY